MNDKKERELNFELDKLKLQNTVEHSSIRAEFDTAKNIKLAPKFQEKSVDKYFPLFKKNQKILNGHRRFGQLSYKVYLLAKQLTNTLLLG